MKLIICIVSWLCIARAHYIVEVSPRLKGEGTLLQRADELLKAIDRLTALRRARFETVKKQWIEKVPSDLAKEDSIVELGRAMREKKSGGADVAACEQLFDAQFDVAVQDGVEAFVQKAVSHVENVFLNRTQNLRQEVVAIKRAIAKELIKIEPSLDGLEDELKSNEDVVSTLLGTASKFELLGPDYLKERKMIDLIRDNLVAPVQECLDNAKIVENSEDSDECDDDD